MKIVKIIAEWEDGRRYSIEETDVTHLLGLEPWLKLAFVVNLLGGYKWKLEEAPREEKKNMKVWIVTSGEYSDYEVDAVFSSLQLAQEYSEQYKRAEFHQVNDPDEWEIDTPKIRVDFVRVGMRRDGEVASVEPTDGPEGLYHCTDNILYWTVATDDLNWAAKVVNEKRAQIVAADAWGDNKRISEMFGATPGAASPSADTPAPSSGPVGICPICSQPIMKGDSMILQDISPRTLLHASCYQEQSLVPEKPVSGTEGIGPNPCNT